MNRSVQIMKMFGSGTLPHRYAKILLGTVVWLAIPAEVTWGQVTLRASVGAGETDTNGASERASLSSDGRYVAFQSAASNLVSGDTNAVEDVFVYDRQEGTTVRVSVSSGGSQGDGTSERPAISADGRFVAFVSDATNLVSGDINGARDVFVHDRDPDGNGMFDEDDGETTRVSIATSGEEGNDDSTRPAISADGRFVAFRSDATTLVANDTNLNPDVFLRDRQAGTTIRASVNSTAAQGNAKSDRPSLSADGTYVAFFSDATNLVAGDSNGARDVFVYDRNLLTTVRVSVGVAGTPGNANSSRPSISADGRFVAFFSDATNLTAGDTNAVRDIFVHDRDPDENGIFDEAQGSTELVSEGLSEPADGASSLPVISANGQFVAFRSDATNLVDGDTNAARDVFVFDRQAGTTIRASMCGSAVEGNENSSRPSISADGGFVAFQSSASNLVAGDANGAEDVFVYDRDATGGPGDPCDFSNAPPTASNPPPRPCGAMGMCLPFMLFVGLVGFRAVGRRRMG